MAKISARGDEKVASWKTADGCRLVLTKQGRLLRNYLKGDGLSVVAKAVTPERAARYADRLGFVKEA